jgi:hypothetical protein
MTKAGNINEAENFCLKGLLDPTSHNFSVAGIFYQELSQLTDEELNLANFPGRKSWKDSNPSSGLPNGLMKEQNSGSNWHLVA